MRRLMVAVLGVGMAMAVTLARPGETVRDVKADAEWRVEKLGLDQRAVEANHYMDFECLPLDSGDGECWSSDGTEYCVGPYSIVDSGIDGFGARSMGPSALACLDDNPGLLMTFDPPPSTIYVSVAGGSRTVVCWENAVDIGDAEKGMYVTFDTDPYDLPIGATQIAGCVFHVDAIDDLDHE